MNCNAEQLETLVRTVNAVLGTDTVSEKEVVQNVLKLATVVAPDLSNDCLEIATARVQASRRIRVDIGDVLAADHTPWLDDRKKKIDWKRWNAYSQFLSSKMIEPQVIDAIHKRQDIILDLAGDPAKEGAWARRGLVIGDVQSGKTANYIALFNKAADSGYRAIILLAGHTDKLRRQTQARVDEGFVGRDSRLLGKGLKQIKPSYCGVGLLGVTATPFTTYSSDFSASQVAGNNIDVAALNSPVIFVIKKNKKIIDNLVQWLGSQLGEAAKLKTPLLLLDDEADFASINTSKNPAAATAINQGIKDLLGKFEKNSYVGFTATPFANVLIDDEQPEDLFPRDFIFCLDSPSNYFGPSRMFADEESGYTENKFIQLLEDAESVFPFKHRRNTEIAALPESLIVALRSFYLVNAIRDIRGQETQPRSMLINVSRFVDVQQRVFELVQQKSAYLKNALKYDSARSGDEWKAMEEQFAREFQDAGATWAEVQDVLVEAIDPLEVHVVNSRNASEAWDSVYSTSKARVIAIGGDVLSRGLTLEGLSTSYFYRKSLAYDTLMQMGRWFGYRDGYDDLCRLWIDEEVASWYEFIAEATADLRNDLKEMRTAGLTPKEFGLKIRQHPGAMLTVTAMNKSRSGKSVAMKISLFNSSLETARLSAIPEQQQSNLTNTLDFVQRLHDSGISSSFERSNSETWRGVPKAEVANFLSKYVPAESEPYFGATLATFIATAMSPNLQTWDVALISGRGVPFPALNPKHRLAERKVFKRGATLLVGGQKMRLGGRSDLSIAMNEDYRGILNAYKLKHEKEPAANEYRALLKNPLLLVYLITATQHDQDSEGGRDVPYVTKNLDMPLVGVHVSFPKGNSDSSKHETVTYLVNTVWQRFNDSMTEYDLTDEDSGADLALEDD